METSKVKLLQSRAPIVVVLGHVDHGKTSLLDSIRKTSVASSEAGGITQKIGASSVQTKGGEKITFIDTPGHAAFSQMRSRGASVADIAVLVIAADDGIKPQTREALDHIKAAKIPFVVAISKIDLTSARIEAVKGDLEKSGIALEGRGGNVPVVEVSAKQGRGLDELLETIVLIAQVEGIKSNPQDSFRGVVIESSKNKAGPVASVVVRDGRLSVGDVIYAQDSLGKVKALFNTSGTRVNEALPGEVVGILGFEKTPPVGLPISTQPQKPVVEEKNEPRLGKGIRKLKPDQLPILIKAETKGSLEAVTASMPEKVVVIESGVGDVNESDVLQAKASGARIFAFGTKAPALVMKLAQAEKVSIEKFEIIYELIGRLEEILSDGEQKILGKAKILASFPFNDKKVAGGKVEEGRVAKGMEVILIRDDREMGKAKITSLKREKNEISQALAGEEFGAIFDPQLDFSIGDVILSVANQNG